MHEHQRDLPGRSGESSNARELTAEKNEWIRAAALRLAGAWHAAQLFVDLSQTAEAAQTSDLLRQAAIDGLAAGGSAEDVQELKRRLVGSCCRDDQTDRRNSVAKVRALQVKSSFRKCSITAKAAHRRGARCRSIRRCLCVLFAVILWTAGQRQNKAVPEQDVSAV